VRCINVFRLIKGSFGTKLKSKSLTRLLGVDVMTTLQAICLGAMLAWTPALIVVAWVLYEAPLDELQEFERDPS
jgi:hypothetical protein